MTKQSTICHNARKKIYTAWRGEIQNIKSTTPIYTHTHTHIHTLRYTTTYLWTDVTVTHSKYITIKAYSDAFIKSGQQGRGYTKIPRVQNDTSTPNTRARMHATHAHTHKHTHKTHTHTHTHTHTNIMNWYGYNITILAENWNKRLKSDQNQKD